MLFDKIDTFKYLRVELITNRDNRKETQQKIELTLLKCYLIFTLKPVCNEKFVKEFLNTFFKIKSITIFSVL